MIVLSPLFQRLFMAFEAGLPDQVATLADII
jgi:hypothetical protein